MILKTSNHLLFSPSLQTILTLSLQLIDWSIFRKVCELQNSKMLSVGDIEVMQPQRSIF